MTTGRELPLLHRAIPPRAPAARPPLVVLLHGIGADEEDLLPLAALLDPRFLVVSARAPHEAEPMGFRWYAIDWTSTPPRGDAAEMAASRDLLARFVAQLPTVHGSDPARTFLLGFSQGAIMALALLVARPDLVRGVVAHSGRLSRLPGPEPSRDALAHAEVLLLHGAEDDVVPAAESRKAYDVLAPLLPGRVTHRAFPRLAHGISDQSAREAARWLAARLDAQ